MDFINSFWDGLSLLGKFNWIIAIPSTIVFIVNIILALIGGDADADHDVGDVDISEGFSGYIISFKTILSFLTMFSWSGILAETWGLKIIATIGISVIAGFITMVAMAFLLYFLSKLTQDGTMKIKNAIGETGYVYLPIPEKMAGKGQIQIEVQGSLRTLEAMTEDLEPIKSNTNIEVVTILENNVLLVKKIR